MTVYPPICKAFEETFETHSGEKSHKYNQCRGERERLFGTREREGKLKITFPFYGKGTGIRKLLREGKGREI